MPGRGGGETGGCLDQSNFPEAAVVAGAPGGADVVGATVVLPERGGSPALFPAGAGSAAIAFKRQAQRCGANTKFAEIAEFKK